MLSVPAFTRVKKMRSTRPFALASGWGHSVALAMVTDRGEGGLTQSEEQRQKNKVYPWFVRGDMDGFSQIAYVELITRPQLPSQLPNRHRGSP